MKYYFKDEDSEICYSELYFENLMTKNGLKEIEVFKAIPDRGSGFFWCKKHEFCGDDTSESCGINNCHTYEPRNGRNGCCKHHTNRLYEHGEKVKLQAGGMATKQ